MTELTAEYEVFTSLFFILSNRLFYRRIRKCAYASLRMYSIQEWILVKFLIENSNQNLCQNVV